MIHRSMVATAATFLSLALAAGTAAAARYDSVVVIDNQSSWDIHQLYLSSTQDSEWGPDQLGSDVIASGDTYQIHSIPCDDYDVQLVDEDGDVCVVGGVPLCGDQDDWVITDEDLLNCQAESQ